MKMGKLGSALFFGIMTIAVSSFSAKAVERSTQVGQIGQLGEQLAQATDTGCRQTNAVTGIYLQPDLNSTSAGVLSAGQTIRLQVLGTGTGWVRISEPAVGWVEAKYLTPVTPCATPTAYQQINPSIAANPPGTTPPQPAAPAQPNFPQPTVPPVANAPSVRVPNLPSPQQPVPQSQTRYQPRTTYQSQTANQPQTTVAARPLAPAIPFTSAPATPTIVAVTCDVLPAEGLIVRTQPDTGTGLYTLPQGTYNFQFTGATRTVPSPEGQRRWAYIVSPYQGWISVGVVNGGSNLGGRTCG
ncbi:MAG TPA: hypothetical protein V6D10_22275 [Trichocoleus sp.]|jgi:hypothetical protein